MTSETESPDTANPGAPQPETAVAAAATAAVPAEAGPAAPRRRRSRGGRGKAAAGRAAAEAAQGTAVAEAPAAPRPPRGAPHPTLEQLASLHPQLFGAVFVPLKRGIFQDLLDAHPGVFEREALKTALGLHTRSTRYLQTVAEGRKRHDLAGQPVEALAPEHVHHALIELWRRRQGRTPEAQRAELREQVLRRIVRAFEASGLPREDYAERVRTRDEAATALLDEALAEAAARAAKDEALLRALQSSGQPPEAFAEMYGLDVRSVRQALDRAGRRAAAPAASAAEPETAALAPADAVQAE